MPEKMFNVRKVISLTVILQVILWSICCKSDGDVIDTILKGYNAHHKPNNEVHITIEAGLLSVQELDNKRQFLSSTMWMTFSWYDHRVFWNASLSSQKSILADSAKFWKPELILGNSIKGQELLRNEESLLVTSHGNVTWLVTGTRETRCPLNIYKFPFDTQICAVVVGGRFGVYNRIHISSERGVDMKQFEENSEFEISTEDITEKIDVYKEQTLCITIHLKRRPLFYIFTILLPVVLLYSLNPFVFLLPSQGGEKISMAVSVLLSFQLFLSIIRDTLPENSLTVSLFSIYVSLANFTSVIIVVVNILLLNLKDKWILRMCKKNSTSNQVDVGIGNVEEDEHRRPTLACIETQLNKTCFLCFFGFSISITAMILGMLTR